jgi:sucrose phosphorylase
MSSNCAGFGASIPGGGRGMPPSMDSITTKLVTLYGADRTPGIASRLLTMIGSAHPPTPAPLSLSERDVILITYGDQVRRDGEMPLATLHDFLKKTVQGCINTIHILPFYPYSSDDGFSVIDYYRVNEALGDWAGIHNLHQDFRLMFDAVFNHISVQSDWFQAFLRGEPPYDGYFIAVNPNTDLSQVRRPRALPLLTPFETARGTRHVWTTFSGDQVDLDVGNPEVLLELIRVLLFYVQQGADLIRLDAIAYLWKTIGTSCIHLAQTHLIIQLMRDILDMVAPHVLLVTETNVPHEENISYFGDGTNEAQMVYQFTLPPLVLHTFRIGDTRALRHCAARLQRASDRTTFFNFLASHDGIGVQPASGLLSASEIDALIELAQAHGGYVSYKYNHDGSRSPYELNITYFDAITHPDVGKVNPALACRRFLCAQAIMLALAGVPGIYFHSLFGSQNDRAGVEQTGRYRTINRQKLDADMLFGELRNLDSIRSQVYRQFVNLLTVRTNEAAFHPLGDQKVLEVGDAVFGLERLSPDGAHEVVALHNVTGRAVEVAVPAGAVRRWSDLLDGARQFQSSAGIVRMPLAPYQVAWLKAIKIPT